MLRGSQSEGRNNCHLPFSTDVGFAKKSKSVKIQAEVTFGGRKQCFTLWAHAWTAHGSTRTADGDVPDAYPILWHVLGCEDEQYEGRDPVKLEWVVKEVKVPLMCQAEAPLKKASGRVDVLFKVPILTNATELHVGDFAWNLFRICFMDFFNICFCNFSFFSALRARPPAFTWLAEWICHSHTQATYC